MKRLFFFLVLLTFAWSAGAAGMLPASQAKRPAYRYLFVIDNSSSLRAGTNTIQASLYNIISTGAFGDMKAGDSYTIMSFNDGEPDLRFPAQTWHPRAAASLAAKAAYFVQQIKFNGKSNLDKAVSTIKETASGSQLLTVFLFSDGKEVLYGTPFDLPVSTIYIQYYPEMSKAHRPFLTTLVMATGEFDGWAVEPAGGRVSIPNLTDAAIARLPKPPAPPKVEPPAPKPVRPPPQSIIVRGPLPPEHPMTNPIAPSVALTPAPAAPVVQVETRAPVTPVTVTPLPAQSVAVAPVPVPAAPVVATPQPLPAAPVVAPVAPAPAIIPVPVETRTVVATPAPTPAPQQTTVPAPPPVAPVPVAVAAPVTPAPVMPVAAPAPVQAEKPAAPQPAPPVVPLAAGTQSAKNNSPMLIPGFLFLIVGIGFFVLYLRAGRRSTGGSLISRSIDQQHR